jgi:hypothetical protein
MAISYLASPQIFRFTSLGPAVSPVLPSPPSSRVCNLFFALGFHFYFEDGNCCETSVPLYDSTQGHIPEVSNFHTYRRYNLNSHRLSPHMPWGEQNQAQQNLRYGVSASHSMLETQSGNSLLKKTFRTQLMSP